MAQAKPSPYPALLSKWQIVSDELSFDLPKDLKNGDHILWTHQADQLARELAGANTAGKGFAERFFMLSGPSGIGKSCLALSVLVQMKRMGEKVLYVPDAAALLRQAHEDADSEGVAPSVAVTKMLRQLYNLQNTAEDLMDTDTGTTESPPKTQTQLVEMLNRDKAIVIFDEQGKAFLHMKEKEIPQHVFGLIYPDAYEIKGKEVRVLFTGSNQESFETTLNSSYQKCRRHVQPMIEGEVTEYCVLKNWTTVPLHDFKFYCNFVPREMNIRMSHDNGEKYTNARRQTMYEDVATKVTANAKTIIAAMLENLFFGQSFAVLTDTIPFFDMGLIYRKENDVGELRAFPMCHPAEKALTALWKFVGRAHMKPVNECVADSDGIGLEKLVLSKFLFDLVGSNGSLPTFRLGAARLADNLAFNIDAVYTATCSNAHVVQDVLQIRALARQRDIAVLYHCPKGTKTMDYCIISKSGVVPTQVSLQSLTEHEKPDPEFLKQIGAFTPEMPTRSHDDWKYVYITTSAGSHPQIANAHLWSGIQVDRIRIVDAKDWLAGHHTA